MVCTLPPSEVYTEKHFPVGSHCNLMGALPIVQLLDFKVKTKQNKTKQNKTKTVEIKLCIQYETVEKNRDNY